MKQLALALALTGSCVFATTIAATPACALETYEAQMQASDAASQARIDMIDAFDALNWLCRARSTHRYR